VVGGHLPPPGGRLAERTHHLRHRSKAARDAGEAKIVTTGQKHGIVVQVHADGAWTIEEGGSKVSVCLRVEYAEQ